MSLSWGSRVPRDQPARRALPVRRGVRLGRWVHKVRLEPQVHKVRLGPWVHKVRLGRRVLWVRQALGAPVVSPKPSKFGAQLVM